MKPQHLTHGSGLFDCASGAQPFGGDAQQPDAVELVLLGVGPQPVALQAAA